MKTLIIFVVVVLVGAGVYVGNNLVNNSKVDLDDIQKRSGTSKSADSIKSESVVDKYSIYEKPGTDKLRELLTDEQFYVTQKEGTEYSFANDYWDNKAAGIYVDILSGEPLFSSIDKFKSGTGWPSFTRPLEPDLIVLKEDYSIAWEKRVEVRSKFGDNHLGHVFNDGPDTIEESAGAEPTGLRYCMNSASMRFIPKENLEKEGYGDYLALFESKSEKIVDQKQNTEAKDMQD